MMSTAVQGSGDLTVCWCLGDPSETCPALVTQTIPTEGDRTRYFSHSCNQIPEGKGREDLFWLTV